MSLNPAEKDLLKSQVVESLTKQVLDPFLASDPDGVLFEANEVACELWGVEMDGPIKRRGARFLTAKETESCRQDDPRPAPQEKIERWGKIRKNRRPS
jgi:hypothetical protein